jgi:hypothetical protein
MFGLSKKEKALRASRARSFQVLMDATDNFLLRWSHCCCNRCGEGVDAIYLVEPYQDTSPAGEIFNKEHYTFLGILCRRCQEVREGAHPTRVNGPGYSVDEWIQRRKGK